MVPGDLRRVGLHLRGEVQGVGFRPKLVGLAGRFGLSGRVFNAPGGVWVEVQGPAEQVEALTEAMRALPPPVRIRGMERVELDMVPEERAFVITPSVVDGEASPGAGPDLALCPACAAEVEDPNNRRFGHAFASCTDCGPRASIASGPVFDRAFTTMATFPLCPACRAEYEDPTDRRFHAQTLACPDCGPRVWLWDAESRPLPGEPIAEAAALVRAGHLLGLKGLGGYQLLADATDAAAVAAVRRAKGRPDKPLAVMVADLAAAGELVEPGVLSGAAGDLSAPEGPIGLFPWDGRGLAVGVAEGELGLMLPTTSLHLLLARRVGRPLVCTSANPSGEPLPIEFTEARRGLGSAVAAWLDHDRPIARPMEDSLRRGLQVLRRGRGLAPRPFPLPECPCLLAMGASWKNAPGLAIGGQAWILPQIGDVDSRTSLERMEAEIEALLAGHRAQPEAVLGDAHPDLPVSLAGRALADRLGLPWRPVLHHEAHLASLLAEWEEEGPALGLVWDGFGLGADGGLWGGEALLWQEGRMHRVAGLRPLPLPGGDRAAREPARLALGLLHALGEVDGAAASRARAALGEPLAEGVEEGLRRGIFPSTSSVGRLFEGVAFLLGGPARCSYEGQAAGFLERLAAGGVGEAVPLPLRPGQPPRWDWEELVRVMLDERRSAADRAMAFHRSLVEAGRALGQGFAGVPMYLGGGCFQNRWLLRGLEARGARGPRALPAHDGGLALGQLWLGRRR